jgi:hypothetical protein
MDKIETIVLKKLTTEQTKKKEIKKDNTNETKNNMSRIKKYGPMI